MKEIEKCLHCNGEYIPNRRGAQKFCTNSCRSRYWYLRQNKKEEVTTKADPTTYKPFSRKLDSIDKSVKDCSDNQQKKGMGMAGAGESFLGAATANLVTHLLTDPATKNDINELKTIIKGARYFPVNNMDPNEYGEYPFYDIETGNVVYLHEN